MSNFDKYTESSINNDNKEIYNSFDHKNSCRLCLSNEETVSNVFNLYYEDQKLSDLLYHCTSIQVLEDDLFSNICSSCVMQLITLFEFIQRCHSSDTLLKSRKYGHSSYLHSNNRKVIECKNNSNEQIKLNIEIEPKTEYVDIIQTTEVNCTENDFISNHIEDIKYNSNNDKSACLIIKLSEEEKLNAYEINRSNVIKSNYCKDRESSDNQLDIYKTKKVALKATQCEKCLRSFSHKYKLVRHECKAAHAKPYQCEVCSTNFNVKGNLKRHQMIHSGKKLYICEACGKGFIQKVSLEVHRRIHSGNKPYICNFCGVALIRSQDLKLHLARHSSHDEDDIELENNENRSFRCKICQKMTSSLRALRVHKSIHHGPKSYLCSICGKGFVAKQGLLSHAKTHTGDKPYACEFCQKRFAYKATLRDHVFIHTGERPHVCKICQKGFIQHHHLVHHLRTHSGEKPYSCTFCGKSFSLKANLTVHIRIHTGETPYVCDVCCIGFYDSSSLKKHKVKNDH